LASQIGSEEADARKDRKAKAAADGAHLFGDERLDDEIARAVRIRQHGRGESCLAQLLQSSLSEFAFLFELFDVGSEFFGEEFSDRIANGI
jgi:hypothetical protein